MSYLQYSGGVAVDTLKISLDEWERILTRLQRGDKGTKTQERRADERHLFKQELQLFLQVVDVSGSVGSFVVKSRNLSNSGLAFFHAEHVATGTACDLILADARMKQERVSGRVVRSRPVQDGIYEIGVQFDRPIEASRFMED